MRKAYTLLLALGVAAASLTSCSKSTYSFNSAPAYLGSQPVAVAKAPVAATVAPAAEVAAPAAATNVVTPALVAKATPAPVAKAAPAAPVAEAATVATVEPAAAKAAKPSLLQRMLINKVAKQLAKAPGMKAKQVAAGLENADKTQSMRKTAVLLMIAGGVLLIAGIVVAAASAVSTVNGNGDGSGVGVGAIMYILGIITLLVGTVLLIVSFFR